MRPVQPITQSWAEKYKRQEMNISEDTNASCGKTKKNGATEVVVSDAISSKTKILIPISNFNLINLFSSSKDAPLKFNYIINNANISQHDLLCLNTNEEEAGGSRGVGQEETTPTVVTASGKVGKKSAPVAAPQEGKEDSGGGAIKLIVGEWKYIFFSKILARHALAEIYYSPKN